MDVHIIQTMMVLVIEMFADMVCIVILGDKPEMLTHSFSKCSFCVTCILFFALLTRYAVDYIVSFTFTLDYFVVSPIGNRTKNDTLI